MRVRYLLQVDLSVSAHARLPNEVDDPFLAFALREFERCGKVTVAPAVSARRYGFQCGAIAKECSRDIDLLVNADIGLTDYKSGVLEEFVLELAQEEVIVEYALCFAQPSLGAFKVKIPVQIRKELSDGVFVLIRLSLQNLYDSLQ